MVSLNHKLITGHGAAMSLFLVGRADPVISSFPSRIAGRMGRDASPLATTLAASRFSLLFAKRYNRAHRPQKTKLA